MRISDELRRQWGPLLACVIAQMTSVLTFASYTTGVFVLPLSEEFGWTRQQILTGSSIVTLGAMVASYGIGWLADRARLATIIIVSQAAFGCAYVVMAIFTDESLSKYYGLCLLLAFAGSGALPITLTKVLSLRFVRSRGLALGLVLSGTGLCGVIVPAYVAYFVSTYGWRTGFVALGALPALVALPLAWLFLRKDPAAVESSAADATPAPTYGFTVGEALKTLRFWTIAVAIVFGVTAGSGFIVNLVPLLIDRGYSPTVAASTSAFYGIAVICGRIMVGALADRYWAPMVAACVLFPGALATFFIPAAAASFPITVTLVLLIGLAQGAEGDLLPYLVSRYFGLKNYGQIFACGFIAFSAGIALGAPLYGAAYDLYKSYDIAMMGAAACWFISGVLFLTLGRYPQWTTSEPAR